MKTNLFIFLFAAFLMTACRRATNSNPIPTILNIRAYIDGRSQLIIKKDLFVWRHFDFDAPGRWGLGKGNQPTYLNGTAWYPSWPDIPDWTNDSCACFSSYYKGVPSLARRNQRVWLDIVQGREGLTVIQQPNTENDFTFILEVNDDNYDGAEWYEINLNYLVEAPY